MDRRVFLKSSGLALVAGGFVPRVFVRMAAAEAPAGGRVLVAIFLRGAVDGLNVVVPWGEDAYYAARPTIAVPRPGAGSGGALDLDGFFGLHPSLEPLLGLYRDGAAAFVHAAGSPDPTRSHFDAQDFMESGTPGTRTTRDGFLARALAASPRRGGDGASPVRAAALTRSMPRILAGADGAVAVERLDRFGVRTAASEASDDASALEAMYAAPSSGDLRASASESFEALRVLEAAAPSRLAAANGAQYPPGPLGRSLAQIAQLIRSGVGLEVAFADAGGWDTHAAQGAASGQLANRLRELGLAIAAFARDLGSRMSDVTLVTMSEFGRTVAENGNRGTDHGHGNAMMLVGGGVRGGRVYGRWPGLSGDRLYERRDLGVTTDFRDVFAEVLESRMGLRADAMRRVFPAWEPKVRLGVTA
jgi:uncharacterized protein (DUF1501 family)